MVSNSASEPAFVRELQEGSIHVSDEVLNRFDLNRVQAYYRFLKDNNQRGGFFSKGDTERILERHLFESLIFAYYVSRDASVSRETSYADAGSGPGLPGYLFSCLKQAPQVTLVDSSRRRLGLLEQFHRDQSPDSAITFSYQRLEDIKNSFDLISIRALIPFPYCLELVTALQSRGGRVAYFGTGDKRSGDSNRTGHSPENWTKMYLTNLGYVSRETIHPSEIQFLGDRSINILLKTSPTKKGYPRPWKTIRDDMRASLNLA